MALRELPHEHGAQRAEGTDDHVAHAESEARQGVARLVAPDGVRAAAPAARPHHAYRPAALEPKTQQEAGDRIQQ